MSYYAYVSVCVCCVYAKICSSSCDVARAVAKGVLGGAEHPLAELAAPVLNLRLSTPY